MRAGLTARNSASNTRRTYRLSPSTHTKPYASLTIAKMLYDAGVYVNPCFAARNARNRVPAAPAIWRRWKEPLLDEAMDIMASVLKEEAK
ncbi:MAG: hypothetical protein R2912_11895 [Eubacteriales bacterium]